MFHMNQNLKIVLAAEPVDLRKSFNGLYTVARNELGEIPGNGALYIFSNRLRNRIKILCFDGTGCRVSTKRLEQGTFSINLWDKLLVYTKHAEMEIDNNLVENAIRPTAIGKRTGSSSAVPERGKPVPSTTPSSKPAENPMTICAMFCHSSHT